MKKLLSILGAIGMTVTTAATVIACGSDTKDDGNTDEPKDELVSINDIKIETITAGMTKANVEDKILLELFKIAEKVTEEDYTIEGLKDIVEEKDTITVKAESDSKVIEGEFKFEVGEADPLQPDANALAEALIKHEYKVIELKYAETPDIDTITKEINIEINSVNTNDNLELSIFEYTLSIPEGTGSRETKIAINILNASTKNVLANTTIEITINRAAPEGEVSLNDAIKLPALFSGEIRSEAEFIAEVIKQNENKDYTIDPKDLTVDEGFYGIGEFADGKGTIRATNESNFTGSMEITIYNPEFVARVISLRQIESYTPEKRDGWNDYVTFRWGVVEEELQEGRITATITEKTGKSFRAWIMDQFISGLAATSVRLGITRDYSHYTQQGTGNIVFDENEDYIYFDSEFVMYFYTQHGWPENTGALRWEMKTPWKIPFEIKE